MDPCHIQSPMSHGWYRSDFRLSDPIKIVSTTSLQPKFIAKNLPTNAQLLQLPNSFVTTAAAADSQTSRYHPRMILSKTFKDILSFNMR